MNVQNSLDVARDAHAVNTALSASTAIDALDALDDDDAHSSSSPGKKTTLGVIKSVRDDMRDNMRRRVAHELARKARACALASSAPLRGAAPHDFVRRRRGRWIERHATIMAGDELDELIAFTSDKNQAVRTQALEIIQGLTGGDDGCEKLRTKTNELVPKLLNAIGREGVESKYAATALVNLTHDPWVITEVVNKGAVERAMDGIRDGDGAPVNLLLSLLANVTTAESGVHVICQEGKALEGFYVSKLIQLLTTGKPEEEYDHAASVLTNITRDPIGRRVFLDLKRGLLASVIPFMSQANELRRERVAAALRNCCMDDIQRQALLNYVGTNGGDCEHEVVRALLRPISGKTVGAELNDHVRQACAEAIFALAKDSAGREVLGKLDAPRLLRDGYELEEHAETCAALVACGELFMKHNMVPADLQEGLNNPQACEVVDDDEGMVMGPGFGGGFINTVD